MPQWEDKIFIQQNSVKAVVGFASPTKTHKTALPGRFQPQEVSDIISCLIYYESRGNQAAVGDNGKAIGVLQFWEKTFKSYAEKYQLDISRYNEMDQKTLAVKMLLDDPKNIYHWTTASKCLTRLLGMID